jgi:methyl halide transferase
MTEFLSKDYWNNRYETEQTGWDLKTISPPLKAYIDQLTDKNLQILMPGCGSGYEARYLAEQGFQNVTVIDIAPLVVEIMKNNLADYQQVKVIEEDFFIHTGEYDLILEQTFFCAINPSLRTKYVQKMSELLNKNGKLVGLLFELQFPNNPPFGGSREEYGNLFSERFDIKILEPCYNSIKPRQGNELFFNFSKDGA